MMTVTDTSSTPRRPRSGLFALLAINAALLVVLVTTLASPSVQAQLAGRNSYLMVAGAGERSSTNLVWILETHDGELALVDWLPAGQGMKAMAHRNVQQDIESILKSR